MTREEAILHMTLRRAELKHSVSDLDEDIKAFDMAIEALSAEPCEDAISREQAIKECFQIHIDGETFEVVQVETLMGVPSVQPVSAIEEIKAEINQEYLAEGHHTDYWVGINKCLEIINKHTSREGDE